MFSGNMYCLVVRRGDYGQYDLLYKAFGDKMPVIWERRNRERRHQAADESVQERRQSYRRGFPQPSWLVLGFAVANRQSELIPFETL